MGLNGCWSAPSPPFPAHPPHQLKYSRRILTIVPQLVDIFMMVASYFSNSTCSGSRRKRDIHSNKSSEIWIALSISRDNNHLRLHRMLYTHTIIHWKLMYSISCARSGMNMSEMSISQARKALPDLTVYGGENGTRVNRPVLNAERVKRMLSGH